MWEEVSRWASLRRKFNETVDIVLTDTQTRVDLFLLELLDVMLSIEKFSWFKRLLDILNIESISFGMTVLKLLRMLYSLIKPKLRMKLRNQIAQFLIYLLVRIRLAHLSDFRLRSWLTAQIIRFQTEFRCQWWSVSQPMRNWSTRIRSWSAPEAADHKKCLQVSPTWMNRMSESLSVWWNGKCEITVSYEDRFLSRDFFQPRGSFQWPRQLLQLNSGTISAP